MSYHTIAFVLLCTFAIHCQSPPDEIVDQDPTNKKYMQIAWKAAKTLNEDPALNPGSNAMMPIKVLRAQSRVREVVYYLKVRRVREVVYYLKVLYSESDCELGGVDLSELQYADCRVMNDWEGAEYNIRYHFIQHYSKPWEDHEVIEVSKS